MTIMDAIERAKLLDRGRREHPGLLPEEHRRAVVEPRSDSALTAEPAQGSLAHQHELRKVDLDLAACSMHRILLGSSGHDPVIAQAQAAYRMLRSKIKRRATTENWRRISFTSPGPGEGKTVTALNAAISAAREQRLDLYLLDLDMRNPSMWKYLGLRAPRPISDYLAGGCEAHEVLFATSQPNLAIAGNSEPVSNASELLARPELERLFAYIEAKSPNSMIIVDLPPVLSSDEALVVAPHVSATFLVVSEGVTPRESLGRAVEQLKGFTIGGVILNRSRNWRSSSQYGDSYTNASAT